MTATESEAAADGVVSRLSPSWPVSFAPIAGAAAVLALVPLWVGESRLMMGLAIGGLLFAAYAIAFNVIFGSTNIYLSTVGDDVG